MSSNEITATESRIYPESPLFPDISADDDSGLTEVSSLCINCEEQGETKLLFIQIPFFREVILSSFSCPHCGYSNSEIQSAGAIQEKGVSWSLTVTTIEDLNREVVRTDSASVSIPALDFEIPASSQKGTLSTVEGILQRSIEGLNQEQPIRRALHPDLAEKIDSFIEKLKDLLLVKTPFVLRLDDPSGNSFIENPEAPQKDSNLSKSYFVRSLEQDRFLGLQTNNDIETKENGLTDPGQLDLQNEVMMFNTNCPNCNSPCETNMKVVKIPFFKEVIIMATVCDKCGQRTNEVKSGSGFESHGRKTTLRVETPEDLSRDVLKSETCSVIIPELELESEGVAISGKFTTVEGLVLDLKQAMVDANPFVRGDSVKSSKLKKVGDNLQELADGKRPFTLILDDPNANSYVQDIYTPEKDPRLSQEIYERTFEQNEALGLNDMKTENYT